MRTIVRRGPRPRGWGWGGGCGWKRKEWRVTSSTAPAFGGPIFMQYEGVDGDATAAGHEKWIEIQSCQWATPPARRVRGRRRPPGSPSGGAGRVNLVRKVDKASPLLSRAATTGKVVPVRES